MGCPLKVHVLGTTTQASGGDGGGVGDSGGGLGEGGGDGLGTE